ncbi:MAG: site-2 protease family protein, partial [Planctomycetota bacterium]
MDECLVLIAANFWMNSASYWAILKVAIGLGAVIFVHELGHFLLAKACGVKCDKFYVGFDVPIKLFGQTILPAKLIHWKWGETEYGIGAIPLGGYVKMMGQDDNPGNIEEQVKESLTDGESTESAFLPSGLVDQTKLDPRSYLAKSVVQRMMIISAGVIFNLIFAVIFATVAFKSGVDYQPAMVGNVIGSGPAWVNDLAGADVTKIGDQKVEGYFPYMEMAESIVFNSSSSTGTVELEYIPYGQNSTTVASMSGEKGLVRDLADLPFIGVSPPMKPVVGDPGAIEGEPAERANPPFEVGDKIIS